MSTTTSKDAGTLPQRSRISRPRLPSRELLGTALQAFRTRRLRAALSALGIAIGIGAMVAVVGVSASSEANLLAEINGLGTNLLTVAPGQSALGQQDVLPDTAVPMIGHMDNVLSDAAVYQAPGANVYRTPLVPAEQSGGIGVDAAGGNLPAVMGTHMLSGRFLDAVSDRYPEAVLGYQAAQVLQITQVSGNLMVYLGNTWFTVIGIMSSATLDTSLDSAVFISLPVAERLFQVQPNPTVIYVRASQNDVTGVANLLAATAAPQDPSGSRSAAPQTYSRRAPPPKGSSPPCWSGSARSHFWSARSESQTSWSSACSNAAARSGCAERSAPPAATSRSSSSPSPRCSPCSAGLPA